MKKIYLQLIQNKEVNTVRTELKRWRVFLFWGLTASFTNKKKAAIFQAALNVWVNSTFIELNYIYSELLFLYRSAWPFIDRETETIIIKLNTTIDLPFNKLSRSDYRGKEGSYYAFSNIEGISADMKDVCTLLIDFSRDRRAWEKIKELEIKVIQINRILKEIQETTDPGELGRQIKRPD